MNSLDGSDSAEKTEIPSFFGLKTVEIEIDAVMDHANSLQRFLFFLKVADGDKLHVRKTGIERGKRGHVRMVHCVNPARAAQARKRQARRIIQVNDVRSVPAVAHRPRGMVKVLQIAKH